MTALRTPATADLQLVGIAVPLVVAAVVAVLTSVGAAIALGAASLPASGTLGYALFYSPPDTA